MVQLPPVDPRINKMQVTAKEQEQEKKRQQEKEEKEGRKRQEQVQDEITLSGNTRIVPGKPANNSSNPLSGHVDIEI